MHVEITIILALVLLFVSYLYAEIRHFKPRRDAQKQYDDTAYLGFQAGKRYGQSMNRDLNIYYQNKYANPTQIEAYNEGFKQGTEEGKRIQVVQQENLVNFNQK